MLDVAQFAKDQTVAFGAGIRNEIATHAERAGAERVLVVTTPHQADLGQALADALGPRAVGLSATAAMHTPVDISEAAAEELRRLQADSVLAAGGGSTVGLGKALALRTSVQQIVLPTTYAGSECTPILGQTEDGVKTTMKDPRLLPGTVLYDPELVATLPVAMTVTSALNAMAHAVEALYAQDRSPESDQLAMLGLEAFRQALPAVMADPSDLAAREATQRGAWACGTVLGRVGMALHHKLCHTLGGSFDLPHAETHAIILPHAMAYNAAAVPDLLAPVAALFEGADAAQAVWSFARDLGAPSALKDLGVTETDLDHAADIATRNAYWNPREITREGLRALLDRAWRGAAPAA
ncbi:MAG: maleylacetate reductase [Pseudomonadota bacterium]